MGAFSATSIPKPIDWQDFERKSRVLFECILNDPQAQTHGRGGQEQFGVDIFGRRDSGTGRLVAVQCKGKNGEYGKRVTEAELRREVEKTKKFKPPLDEFILITTAPDDAGIQEKARLLELEIREQGRPLSIAVWGWNALEQRISEHLPALKAFHPDVTPVSDQLLKGIDRNIADHQRQDQKLDYLVRMLGQLEIGYIEQLPSGTGFENFDHLFQIIEVVPRLADITSERFGGHSTSETWPDHSLFHFIESGMRPGKTASPFERFPNLVCDNGSYQLADFIGWDHKKPRIAFVHAKCKHGSGGGSSHALHDVCSQVIKSLIYLRYGIRSLPGFATKWNRPWSMHGVVVESRIQAGGKTPEQARTDFLKQVGNLQARREFWIVLGQILSKERLYRNIRTKPVSPNILQTSHIIMSTSTACQSVGGVLRVFCSP